MKRRRKHRRKQMKITQWFLSLSKKKKALLIAGVAVLVLLIAAVIYVAVIFNKLNTQEIKEEDIVVNELAETVGVGYTNFVLFGGDSRTGDVTKNLNTDSIIIVSLNNKTKEVKMVSVYRDTLLDLTNGKIQKCNSAYSRGGATQAINMLNMNLDLDIKKYVTVDFGSVADLVDMLGGIEVDVSTAEYKAVNKYIDETGQVAGKKAKHLTHSGLQTLDGVQATTYARIRKGVGDDYARTERQRLIIQKVVEKAMKTNLSTINKIIDKIFPQIATNFTMTEILSYATDFLQYKIGDTSGFPFVKGSGTIPGRGSCVFPITLKKNVTQLHEFLYGTKDYEPSSKVVEISGEIAGIVGNRKADPEETTSIGGETSSDTTEDTTSQNQGSGEQTTTPSDDTSTAPEENTPTTPEEDTPTPPGDNTPAVPGDGTPHVHEYVITEKVKATCTTKGINVHKCSCGDTFEKEVEKTAHDWVKGDVTAPTTDSEGYTEYICSKCSETKKDNFTDKLPIEDSNEGDTDNGNQGNDNSNDGEYDEQE